MSLIASNLQAIHAIIVNAATSHGRNAKDIGLVAVSKTFSADVVMQAYEAGQRVFGENYVQEAVAKIQQIRGQLQAKNVPESDFPVWHFIGPIQSNKTADIAENFAWVHSIDREKIATRLSQQRPSHLPPLQICIQINVSGEASKSGLPLENKTAILSLARHIQQLPHCVLRGLMTVPELSDDVIGQRNRFAQLKQLQQFLKNEGVEMDTLSMGMSADLEAAIAEGATLVRIGSALFGQRH